MLQIEIISPDQTEKAATIFHRDGFVAIKDALTPAQLKFAQDGANRVIQEKINTYSQGFDRSSFGDQLKNPEWTQLIDLPTILPILDAIWGSPEYSCCGTGGDFSIPGATIQRLHADRVHHDLDVDFFRDPHGQTTLHDVPAPFIVVNFLMVDFTKENGAIRFVPCTQRSRHAVPSLEEEPEWMQNSIICAPAGTAIIRDVRCWHGGTANTSEMIRPMTSCGYYAPWFKGRASLTTAHLPKERFNELSPRAQELTRDLML